MIEITEKTSDLQKNCKTLLTENDKLKKEIKHKD